MPRSSPEGKDKIKQWVDQVSTTHKKILDIATGQGTYHNLFYKNENLNDCVWYGIEIWPRWIKKFDLKNKYDVFFEHDVRTFDYSKIGNVDLTFAGDILEHMTKDDAVSLVDKLLIISDKLILSIPIVFMPQGADGGNPYEEHIKPDWSHDEVLLSFPNIVESYAGKEIGVYLIQK